MRNNTRSPRNRNRARQLRQEMSGSEQVLWQIIRRRNLGFGFRRQYSVGPYVLDFYCPEASMCVEVDGEQHALTKDRDAKRDAWLFDQGIMTLRIPSLDLFDYDSAKSARFIETICKTCEERTGRKRYQDGWR
ncbi:MAG: DUF559 domain-containing protein [Armatimonadetes bacterium]|nr:DUF559 domain-containing protein [Armatimonadota bacterium]